MKIEYFEHYSPALGQNMGFKVYGHTGKPLVVFPTQNGRFFEFEDFKMVEQCAPWVERGELMIITPDGIDPQTWTHPSLDVPSRVRRHEAYEHHVLHEVLPFVYKSYGLAPDTKAISTGCSMGGYHSANFFFRNPQVFDTLIALSGVYTLELFIGNYMDEHVYFHTPLAYLPQLNDPNYLDLYRQSDIIICVGQGAWEEDMIADTQAIQGILEAKEVKAWIDFWGHDVDHDWPWWRKQLPFFLGHLQLG